MTGVHGAELTRSSSRCLRLAGGVMLSLPAAHESRVGTEAPGSSCGERPVESSLQNPRPCAAEAALRRGRAWSTTPSRLLPASASAPAKRRDRRAPPRDSAPRRPRARAVRLPRRSPRPPRQPPRADRRSLADDPSGCSGCRAQHAAVAPAANPRHRHNRGPSSPFAAPWARDLGGRGGCAGGRGERRAGARPRGHDDARAARGSPTRPRPDRFCPCSTFRGCMIASVSSTICATARSTSSPARGSPWAVRRSRRASAPRAR